MKSKHAGESRDNNSESRIRAACKELVYVSETDAPVEFFSGDVPTIGSGTSRVTTELSDFFGRYTRPAKRTREQALTAKRFGDLLRVLEEELSDLKVTYVGRIRLDIYITGNDLAGKTIGVHTKAVET